MQTAGERPEAKRPRGVSTAFTSGILLPSADPEADERLFLLLSLAVRLVTGDQMHPIRRDPSMVGRGEEEE